MTALGGTPPFVPPQPQAAQKSGGFKHLAPLLALLPLAAKGGGRGAVAALLQGFQQARAQSQQQGRQTAQDQRQVNQDARAQAQQTWNQKYQQGQLDNDKLQRRQAFMKQFGDAIGTLDDPEAVKALTDLYRGQAQAYGVDPASLDAYASSAVTPSKLQTKAAEKKLKAFQDLHGAKWTEEGPKWMFTMSGGERIDFTELLRRSGQETNPNAKPSLPLATDKRGFAAKEITLDGKRMMANFDPDNGNYFAVGDPKTPLVGEILDYQKPDTSGGTRPMTDGQRAQVIGSRRSAWTRFTKAITDRQQAVAKVDSGLAALDRGNRGAATQVIITAFK